MVDLFSHENIFEVKGFFEKKEAVGPTTGGLPIQDLIRNLRIFPA
jgi:hypothetical protein